MIYNQNVYIFTQPLRPELHKINSFEFNVFLLQDQVCHTKFKETSMTYYLPIAEFIYFIELLMFCEMKIATSWIWTQFPKSLFFNQNHYVVSGSTLLKYCISSLLSRYIDKRSFHPLQNLNPVTSNMGRMPYGGPNSNIRSGDGFIILKRRAKNINRFGTELAKMSTDSFKKELQKYFTEI